MCLINASVSCFFFFYKSDEDEQSEIIHIDEEDKSYKSSEDEVSDELNSVDTDSDDSDGFV